MANYIYTVLFPVFQCYIFLFELFAISLLGWYSYRRSDEHSEVTTTNVPELTISNVSYRKICFFTNQNLADRPKYLGRISDRPPTTSVYKF